MIDYIKGEIAELLPARMVLECGGIGYELHISLTTFSAFQTIKEAKVLVYEAIREDAHLLYGFATPRERELFAMLTSVSGVGATTALIILSSAPPHEVEQIIASGDEKSLTLVKGIGSKTAQRIIVDLKNKVKLDEKAGRASVSIGNKSEEEAVSALVMLGFQKAAAQKAVENVLKKSPDLAVEQVIKGALKML
ncbi:MAG: Holliday junction branch migration protein RuvA [Tannerella sp.]|jgi:Holliday junction DNA helicase RuvA|nr:Holliday junction branch migration protein RuvA [Tannerella sp.]